MTATSTHRTSGSPVLPEKLLVPPWGQWAPVAGEWQRWNERVGATFGALSNEWMDFLRRRIAEDMSFQQNATACRSPEQFWRMYLAFFETMANDYRSEFVRLSQLSGRLAEPAFDQAAATGR